jgi:hypothetical protein
MSTSIIQIIKSKCPNIASIIGYNPRFWSKVESAYTQRLKLIKTSIEEGNYITVRKSLIDDMILFKKERPKLDALLSDIDLKSKTIYNSIQSDKKNVDKLRSILKELIIPEEKDSKSYDRVAEIYAIEYLLSRKNLKLIELEYKLTNGKRADCLIQNAENHEYVLYDFFSINIDTSKVEDIDNFGKLLVNRIISKYRSKTIDIETQYPFRLLPILWIENIILKEYFDFLVDSETLLNTEFFMLRGIYNITDNQFLTLFGPIRDFKYLT